MTRDQKILAAAASFAIMAACAVPVFAGSDGWTDCGLPMYRNGSTLAVAPVWSGYPAVSTSRGVEPAIMWQATHF